MPAFTSVSVSSWGYVEGKRDYKAVTSLVHDLVDIVSKNGNLLLNVGPKADGTLPPAAVDVLACDVAQAAAARSLRAACARRGPLHDRAFRTVRRDPSATSRVENRYTRRPGEREGRLARSGAGVDARTAVQQHAGALEVAGGAMRKNLAAKTGAV